jgi:serine/threonine protein kinase
MLFGFHPFYSSNRQYLYARILNGPIAFPEDAPPIAQDFVSKLLIRDPRQRLGCTSEGGRAVRNHPFFKGIDFNALFKKQVEPPFKPDVQDDFDVKYFDMEFTTQPAVITPPQETLSRNNSHDGYDGFSYRRASSFKE